MQTYPINKAPLFSFKNVVFAELIELGKESKIVITLAYGEVKTFRLTGPSEQLSQLRDDLDRVINQKMGEPSDVSVNS